MLATLRRRLGAEAGFTMIELVVAMSVGMVVLFGLYNLLDAVAPASNRVQDRVDAQARGRAAMEQMAQQLRTTVCVQNGVDVNDNATFWSPYAYAGASKVTFYTYTIDQAHAGDVASGTFEPQKRTLQYAGGTITESTWQGDSAVPPNFPPTPVTRTIATDVQPITGRPVFAFKGYSGSPATLNPITPADDGTGTVRVLDADLPHIASIDVNFRAVPSDGRNPSAGASFTDSINTRPTTDLSSDQTALRGPQCQI